MADLMSERLFDEGPLETYPAYALTGTVELSGATLRPEYGGTPSGTLGDTGGMQIGCPGR